MDIPEDNTQYGRREYWDERFGQEDEYDWFRKYSSFRDLLAPLLRPTDSILQVGSGNSSLAEDLYHDGYKNITNVDYSSVVVEKMKEKYAALESVSWRCMDMLDMHELSDGTFDIVLEKGTIDALLAAQKYDPWNPPADLRARMDKVFSEIHRVLKPDGMFISLTFGQPHFRKPFMMRANYDWDCRHWAFGDFGQYFVYALKRGSVDAPRSDMPFGAASTLKVTPRVKGAEDSDDGEEEKDFLLTMGDL